MEDKSKDKKSLLEKLFKRKSGKKMAEQTQTKEWKKRMYERSKKKSGY